MKENTVVLKNQQGQNVTFDGITEIKTRDGSGNFVNSFSSIETEEREVEYTEDGIYEITPEKDAITKVTVKVSAGGSDGAIAGQAIAGRAIAGKKTAPSGTKTIELTSPLTTEFDVAYYEKVSATAKVQDKRVTITENGTTAIARDYGYAGIDNVYVTVEVPSGGGIKDGYAVTFVANGVDYAYFSVSQGSSVSAPVTDPTSSGERFAGWYTAETGGELVQFPYTPTEDVTFYASFSAQVVVGFVGLTNENGVLTLTDDAAGFGTYSTSVSGNYVSVTNPLDNVFPFNQIEEFTDDEGNVFVKYPKLWMKWVEDGDGVIDGCKFANYQVDDEFFIPDAYLSPSGAINDYFALGKYEMSGSTSKGYSKSRQTCLVSITRANARAAARAYGNSSNYYNGYQQLDLAQLTLYNMLCSMYYHTPNLRVNVYGGRTSAVSSWSSASVTGTCDGVTGLNGWNTSTDCVKMLGIENPYGNISKWCDGVYFSSQTIYVHRFPQYFAESTSNAVAMGFSRTTDSSAYITALKRGTGTATKSCAYSSAASDGSATTYYGTKQWYSSSGEVPDVSGHWGTSTSAGLWRLYGSYSASVARADLGARLSYRPL